MMTLFMQSSLLKRFLTSFFLFLLLLPVQIHAAGSQQPQGAVEEENLDESSKSAKANQPVNEHLQAIVQEAEQLKQDIISINQELYGFQEALLYPSNTQLAIFLSYSDNSAFVLDSIEILLDDQLVSSALYSDAEISALKKGGIQRVFLGSLSDGKHKLSLQFNGQGQNDRYFRRKKILSFVKEDKARYIQLIVSDESATGEPVFKVKQW